LVTNEQCKSTYSLSLGVLSVSDRVSDDVLEAGQSAKVRRQRNFVEYLQDLENTSGLLVDQARDTLDTTSSSKTSDSGLGDTLDVVSKDLPVSLGSTLSESFTTCGVSG
jgi:hypothetical protein